MKCCVLMTQVPDTASSIKIGASGKGIDEGGIKWIVSPYDEYALEEAIQIKERTSGSVTVVTYGPERAQQALRECLARGADAAVHVKGGEATFGDPLSVARVLAEAVKKVGPFDLVFAGIKGVGSDDAVVGPMVAELLDMPHVGGVTKLEIKDSSLEAHREIEGGAEVVEASLPCLITAQKGLNEPRYPSLKGIMAAKRMPVQSFAPADLGLDEAALAAGGAGSTWVKLELPPQKSGGKIIQGEEDPAAAARELVRLLHDDAKAI